jgi:quercetin dioxygenase-like cupin family protein
MNDIDEKGMRYYSRDDLHLSSDVPGAKQWAVSLEKTMLTYFEVEANSCFEAHSHESEQITLVLEGILYFEQNETVIEVKAGDVIAIPSNAPHAVFTKDKTAKAVDAWSPVMAKYKK